MRISVLALLCPVFSMSVLAADDPISITLCQIVRNPEQFDGKMVRVRATVVTGFEASILNDNTCGSDASVWFSYGDDRHTPSAATEYALISSLPDIKYPESLHWRPVEVRPLITVKADSEFKRFDSYLSKQFKPKGRNLCISCPLYSVTATFTGRLDFADHRLRAFRNRDGKVIGAGGNGFGHLGAWDVRLVMESVSDVLATKIDPAIYKPKH
jgi:hypothetical protein